MERKNQGNARSVESASENRRGQGQTQTKQEWDGMSGGDDRDRPQMAGDDASDSQPLTGGDITKYRAHVTRISYLSQDRPDLKFVSMQVCRAMASPSVRDMEGVERIERYLAGKPRALCLFRWQQRIVLEAYSDADWGGDRTTRRSVSAGVIMRGEHRVKVWTKKQQLVSLSTAESELYAAVKTASEGLGVQSLADLEIECKLNLRLDASATTCLVNRRDLGKAKHVNVQHLWIQEAPKSEKLVTEKAGTHVNPADLMTKLSREPKMERRLKLMGSKFVRIETRTSKSSLVRTWNHKLTVVVDGEKQWIVGDKVSVTISLQYGFCQWRKDQKSKCFKDHQTRARGRVLTCGTETGTAHGSCDFLNPLLVTLW